MLSRLLVTSLSMAVLASCTEPPLEHRGTELIDSAGVAITLSRVDAASPTCRLSEQGLRIGSLEGDSASQLYLVRDAARLQDGSIVVLNAGTSQVKIYDGGGEFVRQFGRRGEGPGEFKNVWSLDIKTGDTIVIGEYRPWRFSFFTPDGYFVRSIEASPRAIERPEVAMVLSGENGFWIGETCCFSPQEGFTDQDVIIKSYDSSGAAVDTLGSFWFVRYGLLSEELRYIGTPIFGARAAFAYYPGDTLAYAPGRFEQVELWSADGVSRRIVRWSGRNRDVRPEDVAEWKRQYGENASRNVSNPRARAWLEAEIGEHRPIAQRFPALANWDALRVSPSGMLWVKEYRRPSDQGPERWFVFHRNGAFACQVRTPERTVILDVGENSILAMERDELDVEYLLELWFALPSGVGATAHNTYQAPVCQGRRSPGRCEAQRR